MPWLFLVHCGGVGYLFLLHLVYSGPLRLPYVLSSLQPHNKWRCKLYPIWYSSWLLKHTLSSNWLYLFSVQIKGSWSSKRCAEESGNPYSYNSIITNCCATLCGPMPPRWVKISPHHKVRLLALLISWFCTSSILNPPACYSEIDPSAPSWRTSQFLKWTDYAAVPHVIFNLHYDGSEAQMSHVVKCLDSSLPFSSSSHPLVSPVGGTKSWGKESRMCKVGNGNGPLYPTHIFQFQNASWTFPLW